MCTLIVIDRSVILIGLPITTLRWSMYILLLYFFSIYFVCIFKCYIYIYQWCPWGEKRLIYKYIKWQMNKFNSKPLLRPSCCRLPVVLKLSVSSLPNVSFAEVHVYKCTATNHCSVTRTYTTYWWVRRNPAAAVMRPSPIITASSLVHTYILVV